MILMRDCCLQYMLCHRAVRELFLEQLRVIDSHPYENVGNDGRPLAAERESSLTPDYETIFVTKCGEVGGELERVLSGRGGPVLPRMGVGALGRDRSPSTTTTGLSNGEGSGEGSESGASTEDAPALPATLEELQQPAQQKQGGGSGPRSASARPAIRDPPEPANQREPAPQRFRKGNLRLLQTEDGAWGLEEREVSQAKSKEGFLVKFPFHLHKYDVM